MNKPQAKAIFFFLGMVVVGFVIGLQIITALQLAMSSVSVILTILVVIFAVLMTIFFDKPFELELINWPEPEEEAEAQPSDEEQIVSTQPEQGSGGEVLEAPKVVKGALFPHEIPQPHWDVDFSNNKQTYEGSDLPIWILAGWAIFIIWGIIYLVAGLPTAF